MVFNSGMSVYVTDMNAPQMVQLFDIFILRVCNFFFKNNYVFHLDDNTGEKSNSLYKGTQAIQTRISSKLGLYLKSPSLTIL